MIRTLRRRFVATSMAALAILLVILTAGITTVGYLLAGRTANDMLDMLTTQQASFAASDRIPARTNPADARFAGARLNPRDAIRMHHFSVVLDGAGTVISSDLRFGFSVTKEEAADFASRALADGDTRGKIENYRFAAVKLDNGGTRIVFLDNTPQTRALANTLVAAGIVSIAGIVLMFLILLLVSRRAMEPLAKNIERQQRFVTDAGHELKTPLAIILANADALELHHGASKWSGNIRAQVQRLDGLMRHLLTLSRMDEGENAFPMAQVDVSRLVEEVFSFFAEPAQQKGLQISTDIAPDVTVNASAESLALLVSVLADNAVKYADEGSTVSVKLTSAGKKTLLDITNSCQTLPEAPPERLFERFYRGDAARTQKNGGYGIGLSVAQAVAAMHHGKIEAFYDDAHTVRFKVEL